MTDIAVADIPIWDTERLKARIDALPDDRRQALGEAWVAQEVPSLAGVDFLTAEQYRRIEALIDRSEHTAPADATHQLPAWANRVLDLPEPMRSATLDHLAVYAGTTIDRMQAPPLLISTGRLAEIERIVVEAQAEAARLAEETADVPGLESLGPIPEPDIAQTDDLPSAKADMPTLLAWVGEDRNRAARAYAQEHDRPSPRKGVVKKLTAILGDDGLATVQAALAAAQPPPLPIGLELEQGSSAPGDGETETGAAGGEDVGAASPDDGPPSVVEDVSSTGEPSPAAPEPATDNGQRVTWILNVHPDVIASCFDRIAIECSEIANAIRERT